MASRKLRRLTKPEILRQVNPDRLHKLLTRFESHFETTELPVPKHPSDIDPERLAIHLSNTKRNAPHDLLDALFLIDQMATTTGRDATKRVLCENSNEFPTMHDWSHADVALEAWLIDPQLLSRAYASQLSTRNRTLQILLAVDGCTIVNDPASEEVRALIKAELGNRMDRLDRGDVDVFTFQFDGGVRYVVQRGGAFERRGVWNRGQSPSTIGYQPLEYDVVVFDEVRCELAVKRDPVAEHDALREAFSSALTSDANAFSRSAVIDLEPIRTARKGCLWCRDVPGIRHVRLKAVKSSLNRSLKYTHEERAFDLFAAWDNSYSRHPKGHLLKAEFEFEFDDSLASRSVTLNRGASIRLTRDDDSEYVNQWMRSRGFVLEMDDSKSTSRGFWEWLERPNDWLATKSEWQSRLGDAFYDSQYLLSDDAAIAGSIRLDGESQDRDVVEVAADEFVAVNATTGAHLAVSGSDVALLRLDIAKVAHSVSRAFDFTGTVCSLRDFPEIWSLGNFVPIEGEQFPVYLVAAPESESLRKSCLGLAGLSSCPFLLVTPSRKYSTPDNNDWLGAGGPGWLALNECLRLQGAGRFELRRPATQLLREFLSTVLPQQFGQPSRPRFLTPPGTQWSDTSIRFHDAHTVTVSAKGESKKVSYEGMGMADRRSPKPTKQWDLLYAFARSSGYLTWDSPDADRKNQKRRERLADDLRAYFGIGSDPFVYVPEVKGWRARFEVLEV